MLLLHSLLKLRETTTVERLSFMTREKQTHKRYTISKTTQDSDPTTISHQTCYLVHMKASS